MKRWKSFDEADADMLTDSAPIKSGNMPKDGKTFERVEAKHHPFHPWREYQCGCIVRVAEREGWYSLKLGRNCTIARHADLVRTE